MHRAVSRLLTLVVIVVLTAVGVEHVTAQRITFAGGINVGSVPRALAPLCGSARRLRGVGLSARVESTISRLRVGVTIDHVARIGVNDAASCIPRSGISVDSLFATANRSATTLAINAWVPVNGVLRIGAEGGNVINHSSWFIGPALGARYKRIHIELAARRHITQFDEIARDYGTASVREVSRIPRHEGSWGALARLMITP